MNRMVQVSLFALAGLAGASVGALVDRSSEQPFAGVGADARALVESMDHRRLVGLTSAPAQPRTPFERTEGTSVDAIESADDVDQSDPELARLLEQERELAERRAAVIAAAAEQEPADPAWAEVTERQIADGLAAHGPPGVALVSATCKTTLCIVELEHPPGDPGTAHVNWLPMFGLSRGFFVHHPPRGDRRARTVAHLARKGHSLPRPHTDSSAGGPER